MENRRQLLAVEHMRALWGAGALGGQSDARLLEQFSKSHREAAEAAFTTLVTRHGPMVLRVCRGVLGDSHDIHDAFQATFLILVRKSGSLWVRDSLGPWLHGVALRVANKARVAAARRKAHERKGGEIAIEMRASSAPPDDIGPTLHDEIERLPRKYRTPIVLCYLEGQTHEGAASALGWPVGTVRGRLARGRDLLRTRLVRRGVAPSAIAAAALMRTGEASAAPLSESLVHAVTTLVAERSAGVAPAAVAALADASLRMMTMAKLKIVVILVALGLVVIGFAEAARERAARKGEEPARLAAPPVQAAVDPAQGVPETWPINTLVRGKVVDHRGAPVSGADVLLLGEEQLTVFVDRGPRPGTIRYSMSLPANSVPTVKTDDQGRFSLKRVTTPANRIAVVCETMLLWEVTRKEAGNANLVLITLPEPGELKLRAEIPEKPEKLEYWIVGRPGSRVDWESDCFFYRGIEVPNPGERIVKALPPAQYAIERLGLTPTGIRTNLMNMAERRLLRVEAGKRAESSYDRKTGRVVEGHVRGLEQVKLRYGLVTIGYWGPEEQFQRGAKLSKMQTTFDVIPISPDGRFSTPPLPPNEYEFRLTAMRASTPAENEQAYDFETAVKVVVPETGAIPSVEIVAKPKEARPARKTPRATASDPKKARLEIRARDETGTPVKDFEAQLYSQSNASHEAAMGTDGLAVLAGDDLKTWSHGDLIVYAPGFASTIEEIGPIEGLRKVDITLKRGKEVRLRVRDSSGKPIPPKLMPLAQVYLARHRRDAWSAAVIKDDSTRERTIAATNFLNVRREAGGDFVFNIRSDEPSPLYFGFNHPDVVLFFERGPVPASELAGGTWDVVLPKPASLDLAMKPLSDANGKPLFAAGYFSLTPDLPGVETAVPVLDSGEIKDPSWRATVSHVAPGAYNVNIQTTPREASARPAGREAVPGVYYDRRRIDLKPGDRSSVVFEPKPLDERAWRGNRAATVLIRPAGDRSVGGKAFRVLYILPKYGGVLVASGKLPSDGRIALEGIARSGKEAFDGEYMVEVADDYLGKFAVKDEPGRQEFSLHMPPRTGDALPDAPAQDLATGQTVRGSDLRGRVVFLEFWATWCGPCREPMEHLVALAKRRGSSWGDKVALVAISIDKDRDELRRHVLQYSDSPVRHLWSPQDGDAMAGSAYADYVISGVPTAFLIGRDGRILWRGHPASFELERKIDELIEHKK